MQRFTAVYQHQDGWWIGYAEELPGANTQGRTLDEARENLREAARLTIETNRAFAAHECPDSDVIREDLLVGAE